MFNQEIHLQTVAFVMLIFGGDFRTSTALCFAHALTQKELIPKSENSTWAQRGRLLLVKVFVAFCGYLNTHRIHGTGMYIYLQICYKNQPFMM